MSSTNIIQKRLLIIGALVLTLLLGEVWMTLRIKEAPTVSQPIASPSIQSTSTSAVIIATSAALTHGPCLAEGEVAEYEILDKSIHPGMYPVAVRVKNKIASTITQTFIVSDVRESYHSIELWKCGLYGVQEFNYTRGTLKQKSGWREEFWTHDYTGDGRKLFLLAEKDVEFKEHYNPSFRVSPTERYVALTRAFPGKPDFALILKNLTTLKDDHVFLVDALFASHPELLNSLMLVGWSADGRYFWAETHDAAVTLAFIRIDTTTGNAEVFPTPPDVLGGDAFNPDTGYVTQHPGNFWSADSEYDAEVRKEREAKGEGTDLYIHNVITGNRILVAHSPYAVQYFCPKWLSTTTLEYFMPTVDEDKGERREFVLP